MFLNVRPLIRHREYRLLFTGQTVSFLGSMVTYVAMPWQIYELTRSTFLVGLLGTVQLVPLVAFGLLGGSVADSMDRRKLLLLSEGILSVGALVLAWNAWVSSPSVWLIFVVTGLMQAANGFHRPAMDAMAQRLVTPEDYPAMGALNSLRYSVGAVLGPAMGGMLIAGLGLQAAYLIDFLTFLLAMISIGLMSAMPSAPKTISHAQGIVDGLRYALKRPELMGTYIVDIIAMTFAFPTALFPAMAEHWGGAKAAGALFSSMSVGSLIVTMFSGWTSKVKRHGAYVVVSAALWGVAIIALGFAPRLEVALVCLAIAGAADTVSGIFRQVMWNETIPNDMRGRLAGIEMISYMTGPLLGNTRAGWVAAISSVPFSIISGGVLAVSGVCVAGVCLPTFWRYRSVSGGTAGRLPDGDVSA